MAFFKTSEVQKVFFELFYKGTTPTKIPGDSVTNYFMMPLSTDSSTTNFSVQYFNRSGQGSFQDIKAYYPSITIQDFMPTFDETKLWGNAFKEGFYDSISKTKELISLPIPMVFKFQVIVTTKRKKEINAANDWFLSNFDFGTASFFEFNMVETEEGKVGDIIRYRASTNDVPREDNLFSCYYEFTLNIFLHARAKNFTFVNIAPEGEEPNMQISGGNFKDAVDKIVMALSYKDAKNFSNILAQEFTLE